MTDDSTVTPMLPGRRVQVRTHFDGSWAGGFEVADAVAAGLEPPRYRLRRLSDGAVLPAEFPPADVRPDRG